MDISNLQTNIVFIPSHPEDIIGFCPLFSVLLKLQHLSSVATALKPSLSQLVWLPGTRSCVHVRSKLNAAHRLDEKNKCSWNNIFPG